MKPRLFCLWLLLSAAVGLFAYDFRYDDLCYNITSDSTVEVVGHDYCDEVITIPTTARNGRTDKYYCVTSIGDWAFAGSGLTSITIPNSVTSIGGAAFYGCTILTSITVESENSIFDSRDNCNAIIESASNTLIAGCKTTTIPNSVTSIGGYAFSGCSGLTSITIPNSVTSIGGAAFYGCSGLTSITIPNSVTSIGGAAFYGCTILTSITVESENSIFDSRDNCNAIIESASNTLIAGCKTTTIPNSVTSIGGYAFSGCSGLTSITIPNSVTSIGGAAFYGCSGLTSITIPNSVTNIGDWVFRDCTSLTSITIPNSVTSIGGYAFSGCTSLTSITIPNSVTSIGGYAFSGCTSLTSITLPNSVTSIGDWAFAGSGLTSITIPNSVTSIGGRAFSGCSGLTSITIPNSVTSIGNWAFAGSGLTSITIPNSVTNIGGAAFYGSGGLTSVIWNAVNYPDCSMGNTPFHYQNGYLTDLRLQITSFVFGDSVQHIPSYLCYGMDSITSIIIPNSVTSIGDSAFGGSYKKVSKFVCGNPNLKLLNGCFEWFTQDVLDTIVMPANGFDVSEESWATLPKYLKYAQLTGGEMTMHLAYSIVVTRLYKRLIYKP